tara:strand:- start:9341 stop:10279 length:939 start_codon:yes stop_codon:yes gene_type:complete
MLPAILVTVYSRLDSLKECIQSLKDCENSNEFVLYISSDAAFCDSDEDDIAAVREFILNISGFLKVVPIIHNENIGSWNSIHSSIDLILSEYESFIFLEDDVVVGKNFLNFMSSSLQMYCDNTDISFICSYVWPDYSFSKYTDDEVFLWRGYCPWGMATWAHKWKQIDFELMNYPKYLANARLQSDFECIDPSAPLILKDDRSCAIKAMDVRICFNLFMEGKSSLFPTVPLSVNRGHDGRGEHGSTQFEYMEQVVSNSLPLLNSSISVNESIQMYIYSKKFNRLRHKIIPFFKYIGVYDYLFTLYNRFRSGL